jgi:AraC family transcriptional activator of pobA
MAAPLNNDFDIQRIDYTNNESFVMPMEPFGHKFYSVGFYEHLDIEIKAGAARFESQGPFIFIKTPNQIVSWQIQPGIMLGWNLLFTEEFLQKHKLLNNIVRDFSFLQIDQALPFEIDTLEITPLNRMYSHILEESHSGRDDRFDLISSYIYTLLLMLKRLYKVEDIVTEDTNDYDLQLYQRYMALLDQGSDMENCEDCTVSYFAEQLSVHPNYLNAAVKRVTGNNALYFIQERIINFAKTYLLQSQLSIKEIAYTLLFNEPTHFGSFFKKYTGLTPAQFRKQAQNKQPQS